jgi:hypothetical protein
METGVFYYIIPLETRWWSRGERNDAWEVKQGSGRVYVLNMSR